MIKHGFTLLLATVFASPICTRNVQADPVACTHPGVTVDAPAAEIADRVCAFAPRAIANLASCNVSLEQPVHIRVVTDPPDNCFGVYHCDTHQIELGTPEAMQARMPPDSPFATLETQAFFDSVLVHELAHVAYQNTPCPFPDCRATAEYVAYTMQIRSLTSDQIARFEATDPITDQVSRYSLSAILHAFAPDRFAALAWAHFNQRTDPCAYMGHILSGDIVLDYEHP